VQLKRELVTGIYFRGKYLGWSMETQRMKIRRYLNRHRKYREKF
jgi:hypothetical protein